PDRTLDLTGYVVMPGGVEMHCHIAGPKVAAGRWLVPDQMRESPRLERRPGLRSGIGGLTPTSFATGRLFAGLGYTTAMDAAIPGILARNAHDDFRDVASIDKGMYLLFGNNHYVMDRIREGDDHRLDAYLAWALDAAKGYTIKVVNPGGIECWKQISRKTLRELDEPTPGFGVSPRQIVRSLAHAADRLKLPHSVHLHCNNLGLPGNYETTLQTMEALEGARGHFAHIQFHSYAGKREDGHSFASAVDKLFDYVMAHKNITLDVGHVHPGRTLSMTGDAPFSQHLQELTGGRWFTSDSEHESSCGIIPGEYRPEKVLIHAIQWAISLEWYLRMLDDPWRVAMTSDHPNGGAFFRYPEMIHLLMDSAFRREAISRMPPEVKERTRVAEIDREYSLYDIAIITRAAPARILGLTHKGHLGEGADADVAVFLPQDDKRAMFERPRYVFKSGVLVVSDGDPIARDDDALDPAQTHFVSPGFDRDVLPGLRTWFEDHYSIRFRHYTVERELLSAPVEVGSNGQ
ncbi:MAG TPA: formylmethanofuran dehydrogenase subunit A, partial [Pirellulales bacterium]